jgi:hypothetical protein
MDMPINLKPLLIGGAIGAVATAILGFTWGGWVTASKAEVNAQARADTAVVAALAPICVANYRQSVDAQAQLIALGKLDTWKLASFVEEAGWAKMPGSDSVNSTMARTCAEMILKEQS